MSWAVEIAAEFLPKFSALQEDVQTEILALARLLQQFGPQLGQPRVDTLNDSRHANRKELRFSAADHEWRVAFAFDTTRKAILLVAGASDPAEEEGKEVITPTNVDDIIKNLGRARREKVEARTAELIAEETTLRELRQARKLTQVRMAKKLGINPG